MKVFLFNKSSENNQVIIPTTTVTPANNEAHPTNSLSLSLSLIDEEGIPFMSYDDLLQVHMSSPVCESDINAVIWDISGQIVYHGLLSPFLMEDNVAIIVFNASQDHLNSEVISVLKTALIQR